MSKLTAPQRKLLVEIYDHCQRSTKNFRLSKGQWVTARKLKDMALVLRTFPTPTLTVAGDVYAMHLKEKNNE